MADEVLLVKKESLESVADAIREKGGTSAELAFPQEFTSAIAAIPSGGTDISALDVYIADYLGDAPTITTGALDTLNRRIYGT